ncbi:glyoxylase-like metal-dependent hydrolase (beta-lactamase superfamily II) [Roseateles toxinivorans]|uniref:Glyoxylase-like metal-dependent hydrolase (Beta-lactamase superfamily II) n=2 Tax=Roseateles toxinivorans TaxID=270368 RepID=A0A4R6QJN3_9BURK|nr:glyoxylase-like metal-dependent hydrolase (beta-lactamase superfamily II) [Roseateles toxinivorans]
MNHLPRLFKQIGLTAALATAMVAADAQTAAAPAPLELKVINHGPASFHVNSVLVTGAKEAILLDAGFTRADALRVAAAVLDSGKKLSTIYVSAADPDYYFGLEVLRQEFPEAKIVTTAPTLKKIEASLPTKLQVWGPRLGANAPRKPVLPELMTGNTLQLEGRTLEVRGLDDRLAHRSYVWIPSIKAVVGGVNVFGGLHAWTADTQTVAERAAWVAKLDGIAALQPAIVVPGHMLPGTAQDASTVSYTRAYLQRFEAELPKAANAAALIATLQAAYPQAGLGIALDIGAKVNKGEMKW